MSTQCKGCKLFEPTFPDFAQEDEREDPELGTLGRCTWRPPLPWTWRYVTREVTGAWSLETHSEPCPTREEA